jgi:hypothetical protein
VLADGGIQINWIRDGRAEAIEFEAESIVRAAIGPDQGLQLFDAASGVLITTPVNP